jgi:hypothetical protein
MESPIKSKRGTEIGLIKKLSSSTETIPKFQPPLKAEKESVETDTGMSIKAQQLHPYSEVIILQLTQLFIICHFLNPFSYLVLHDKGATKTINMLYK